MTDLIIRQARVVDAQQDQVADVAIIGSTITEIAPQIATSAPSEIDAIGHVLFPGGIDPHVHFNEPGRVDWEGLETGSAALARGGMTSFFDMPLNSTPPTNTVADYRTKRQLADAKSAVNAFLWAGLTPHNLDHLEALSETDVVGFKAFMSNSGIDDFAAVDDAALYRGMRILAPLGKIVAVHAENDSLTRALAAEAIAAGRIGIRDYLHSRPVVAELEAIQRAILFAEETGCKLHIVHVSSQRGVELVTEARSRGVDVTCETCPHYLCLNEADVERIGAAAKCAPPIRSAAEQDALWEALLAGHIQFMASDHSPAPMALKQSDNFFEVWGGIASCQSTLSLLLTEGYHKRGSSLQQIAALLSHNIAERFGLRKKGKIEAGMDADLTLVDVDATYTLRTEDLAYRHKISPYLGMNLRGVVHKTWVGGNLVYG